MEFFVLLAFIFLVFLLPLVVLVLCVISAISTAGLGAFMSAGSERKEHPWKTWGLDKPTDKSDTK